MQHRIKATTQTQDPSIGSPHLTSQLTDMLVGHIRESEHWL